MLQGQVCPSGSAVAGFSISGAILCVPIVIATPAAISDSPPSTQDSSWGDNQGPQIKALSIAPPIVAVGSSPQTITVTLAVSDNLSDVEYISLFVSTSANTNFINGSAALISGTNLYGLYVIEVGIPQYAPSGVWLIREIELLDSAGNRERYLNEAISPGASVGNNGWHYVQEIGSDHTFIVS
ncbi:MAG: hypothetical protein O2884_14700 [Chloroflexi bacterium]|nr:hypothetical protein [Chloroflexota bacterium]